MKLTNLLHIVRNALFISGCVATLGSSSGYAADATAPATTASAKAPSDPKDVKQISAPAEAPAPKLTIRVGAPLWVSAISGEMGVRGRVSPAKYVPFNDIFNHLDYAIPANIEVGYGKWGLLLDGQFTRLSDTLGSRDIIFNPADVQMDQAFAELNISYKVVETDKFNIAPFIGTRFQYLKVSGQASTTGRVVGAPLSFDESKETAWADPILGFQAEYQVFKPSKIIAKADVGGFGAASHLTYQFFIGQQTQITRSLYVDLGYRYLQTDYSSNGFTYNIALSGPQITFGVKF